MKFVTLNRKVHKWAGVVLSIFLLIISLTGILLVHKKDYFLSFKEVKVHSALIPGLYAKEMSKKGGEVETVAIKAEDGSSSSLFVGTNAGLNIQQENTWKMVMPFGGVEVKALLLTEQRWFAGTKKGLYESLDNGKTWKVVKRGPLAERKWIEVKAIEQSPFNVRLIWLGTKNGIYKSLDGGKNWEDVSHILPDGEKPRHVSTIVFDPNNQDRLFLGTHNGLYTYVQGAIKAIEIKALSAIAAYVKPQMTLEHYLVLLHTGKLFGGTLWFLYDLTAIAILFFIGTGIYIWIYPTLTKWRRKNQAKGIPKTIQ